MNISVTSNREQWPNGFLEHSPGWSLGPSHLWWRVALALWPYISPGEYVRQARDNGLTWREVGELLENDTGIKVGCPASSCDWWARVDHTKPPAECAGPQRGI